MLLSAVSVLVVAQSSSEIPEGLMNNPVFYNGSYGSTDFVFIFIESKIFTFMYTVKLVMIFYQKTSNVFFVSVSKPV